MITKPESTLDSPLQIALDRLRIPELWQMLGLEGHPPARDGQGCRSPFREDRHPSFSVYDDGRKWKDHATNESGDAADFLALARNLSPKEACRELMRLANVPVRSGDLRRNDQTEENRKPALAESKPRSENSGKLELPETVPWSRAVAQVIADSRGLSITAIEFSYLWLGTLSFAKVCAERCWILSDASGKCAEARRIDAKPFPATHTLAERKSHALRGSDKSWPVGILPPAFDEPWLREHCHRILLVEGGPDYLAACQLIAAQDENVIPVAMLGASQSISEDALPHFSGRKVVVVAHPDEAGRAAAARWANQIQKARGLARIFNLRTHDLCNIIASGATNSDLQLF